METGKDIKDKMGGRFLSDDEFNQALKAITTGSASAGDIIQPEVDPIMATAINLRYPFHAWLESVGVVQDTTSNKPSYIKKLTGAAGHFIAEAGSLSSSTDSTYDLLTGTMTTHVTELEISDQMIAGSQGEVVDIMEQEIQDALDINRNAINNGMLTGDGTSYTITGLGSLLTTEATNMSGAQITSKFQVDTACQGMMDNGGVPTAIVTDANTKSQLEEIIYPNAQVVPTMQTAFGYQVTTYNSPAGNIPIIVDPGMPTTTDQQKMFIVDYSTLRLKYLWRPRVVDLAKTKLTESSVLASFQSFYCRNEEKNAVIYNIGTKTS
jgi:hypothetical protein